MTTVVISDFSDWVRAGMSLGEDVVWKIGFDWSVVRASKLVTKPSRGWPQTGQRATSSSTPVSYDVVESVDTVALTIGWLQNVCIMKDRTQLIP